MSVTERLFKDAELDTATDEVLFHINPEIQTYLTVTAMDLMAQASKDTPSRAATLTIVDILDKFRSEIGFPLLEGANTHEPVDLYPTALTDPQLERVDSRLKGVFLNMPGARQCNDLDFNDSFSLHFTAGTQGSAKVDAQLYRISSEIDSLSVAPSAEPAESRLPVSRDTMVFFPRVTYSLLRSFAPQPMSRFGLSS